MERHTEALIIGAGPSGISSAITLQKAGITNIVIDKSSFPRNKTCGGLVTNKTLRVLKELLDINETEELSEVFCDSNKCVELFLKTDRMTECELDDPLYFVRRNRFDHYMVKKYRELGGLLYENEKRYEIDLEKKILTLTDGTRITYDSLIAGDGAVSSISKRLGFKKGVQGFCVETYIPKNSFKFKDTVKIYFDVVEKGYAWCFPSGDEYCLGLGGVFSKKTDYKKILKDHIKRLGAVYDDLIIKGAFVPYGKITDQSGGPANVVLAGDAGGFVDPIYGEGLFFALISGMEAAKARIRSCDLKPFFLNGMAPYTKIIKQGTFLQKIFFGKPLHNIFMKKIRNKDSFVKYYSDNQISEYVYPYAGLLKLYRDYKKKRQK